LLHLIAVRTKTPIVQWRIWGMAGMARAMGATVMGAQKSEFVNCSSFNLYFAPHTTINCAAASIQRPSYAIIRACCASSKHCDKTVVL